MFKLFMNIKYIHGNYAKYDNISINLNDTIIASDIIKHQNKHYIKINIESSGCDHIFNLIDTLGNTLGNYNECVTNNILFIKLPYRYNRYEIHWVDLTNSDILKCNSKCDMIIETAGFIKINDAWTACFKCLSINSK